MSDDRACRDGDPIPATMESYEDALECRHCGTRVRWDLADHPFFGFKGCAQSTQDAAGAGEG